MRAMVCFRSIFLSCKFFTGFGYSGLGVVTRFTAYRPSQGIVSGCFEFELGVFDTQFFFNPFLEPAYKRFPVDFQ